MAALLVGLSVAAVLMSAIMPAWKTMAQREKEAELVFRGEQYVRAIGLFQRRSGPGVLPPSVDVLVAQKFLRKKFKDPITGQDFDVLSPTNVAGAQPGGGTAGGATQGGRGTAAPATSGAVVAPQGAGGGRGGVMGVASRSRERSLRLYNGRSRYNEWQFVFVQQAQAPGAGAPGRGAGPGRGGPQPPAIGGPGARGRAGGPGGFQPLPPGGGRGPSPFTPQAPQPLAPRPQR
jgi:type II secretory pathway pseudopilin PulG